MVWNKPSDQTGPIDPWDREQNVTPNAELTKTYSPFINKLLSLRWCVRFLAVQEVSLNWVGPWLAFALLFISSLWFLSGYYIVHPAEDAVVLRYGQVQAEAGPGFHWLPRGIEQKVIVDVQSIHTLNLQQTFFAAATQPLILERGVTPDLEPNVIAVDASVQYRIRDPRAYLFNTKEPLAILQDTLTATLANIMSSMKLDEVLTASRTGLNLLVQTRLAEAIQADNIGIEILEVNLQHIQVPLPVRDALHAINNASQEKATAIQEAETYASEVVPQAVASATRTLADAKAYQAEAVAKAQSEIAQYQALLNVYLTDPGTTRTRMYYDALQSVFTHTHKVLVDEGVHPNLYFPREENAPTLSAPSVVPENKL